MGHLKNKADDAQDQAEAAWARKAEYQDYRCSTCGGLIVRADREIFFETGRCATDANYARRDD